MIILQNKTGKGKKMCFFFFFWVVVNHTLEWFMATQTDMRVSLPPLDERLVFPHFVAIFRGKNKLTHQGTTHRPSVEKSSCPVLNQINKICCSDTREGSKKPTWREREREEYNNGISSSSCGSPQGLKISPIIPCYNWHDNYKFII